MKARLAKAKKFIEDNQILIAYSVGVVAGTVSTYIVFTRFADLRVATMATDSDLNTLLNDKGGFLTFHGPHVDVVLMSEKFVQEHQ